MPPLRARIPGQGAFRQGQPPLLPPFRAVRGGASQGVYGKVRGVPAACKLGHGQAHTQGAPATPILPTAAQGRAQHRHRRVLGAPRGGVPYDSGRPRHRPYRPCGQRTRRRRPAAVLAAREKARRADTPRGHRPVGGVHRLRAGERPGGEARLRPLPRGKAHERGARRHTPHALQAREERHAPQGAARHALPAAAKRRGHTRHEVPHPARQRPRPERTALEGVLHEGGPEGDLDAAHQGRRRERTLRMGRTGPEKQGAKARKDGRHAHGAKDGNTRMVRLPLLNGQGRGHQQQD